MVTDGWFFQGFSGFHFLVLFRCFSFKRVKFPNSSGGEANNPFMKEKHKNSDSCITKESFQDSVLKTGMEILSAIHPASDGFFIGTWKI